MRREAVVNLGVRSLRLGVDHARSKNEALRLLRKMVVVGVLSEETFRADNQYGGVMSHLSVCEPLARRLAEGALCIRMPFLLAREAPADQQQPQQQQQQPKKKAAFPRARKAARNSAGAAPVAAEPEDEVEIIDDDDADDSCATQVRGLVILLVHNVLCAGCDWMASSASWPYRHMLGHW